MLAGLFYILFCWALGNGVSLLIGGYLPGSIVGMILLFASLCLHIVDAEMIRPAARFLLGAMALFFIPYGVGLMVSYEVLLDNFLGDRYFGRSEYDVGAGLRRKGFSKTE